MKQMQYIFTQDEIWEMDRQARAREAFREISALYADLLDILIPLGRVAELQAASKDMAKLLALAHAYGLGQKYNFEP